MKIVTTYEEHLDLWVKGEPAHIRRTLMGTEFDECFPDFSCCLPELAAPQEVKNTFINASNKGEYKITSRMLGEFLGRLVSSQTDKKVHIAGLEESRRELD